MKYNKIAKSLAVATAIVVLGGVAAGCKTAVVDNTSAKNIILQQSSQETAAETAETTATTFDLEEKVEQEKKTEVPKEVTEEIENLKDMLYLGFVTPWAYNRTDDCFNLTLKGLKFAIDDISKNMENSKYFPIIEVLLRSQFIGHDGKVIGYVKNFSEFNTAEKLVKKYVESMDGNPCNYEAFEVPVNKDDLYKVDWVKTAADVYNFRCCEAKFRSYLLDEKGKENNATYKVGTEKACIDDLADNQILVNGLRQVMMDYAMENPNDFQVKESLEMYLEKYGGGNLK